MPPRSFEDTIAQLVMLADSLDEEDLQRGLADAEADVRSREVVAATAARELEMAHRWREVLRRVDDIRHLSRGTADGDPTRRPGIRRTILDAMRTAPGADWSPAEIFDVLSGADPHLRAENVQVTMRRMAARGELTKAGRGSYRLPAAQEAETPVQS